jgi:polyisoprenoid-binding protein YceI
MSVKTFAKIAAVLFSLFAVIVHAVEKRFIIDDPGGRNIARYESKAPLESVVGTTNKVTGYVAFDPDNAGKGYVAEIAVDLTSLDSGIEMRDKYMRSESYLDTEKYPIATLKITRVELGEKNSIKPGETVAVKATGLFSIHGVTKPVEVDARIGYFSEVAELSQRGYPGDLLNVDANFNIKFQDFGIQRPQFMVLRLADQVTVTTNFTAATGRQPIESK